MASLMSLLSGRGGRTVTGILCGFLFSSWIGNSLGFFQQGQTDIRHHREYKQLSCQYKKTL
ncbi:hypothetical protein SAMN05216411_10461 [Nitrosospira multiformis]|nr:hypothetical protein SAMN05216411_10461 [Nitrosospira multiformis]